LAPPALLVVVLAVLLLAPYMGAAIHLRPLVLEGLALGIFAVALARTQPGSLLQRAGRALRAGPNLPLLLLVGYALVSSRLAPYKGLANSEWLRLAGGVTLYLVTAYAAQARDRFRMVVDGLIAIAFLGTLMEFVQYAHSDSPMSAVFGNRQLLASFLLLLMPLLLVVSLAAQEARRKVLAQIAFTVVAGGLLMAQTRSAWAGAMVSLIALGAIYACRSAGQWSAGRIARSKHRIALVLVPVLGAVGLFAAVSLSSPALSARLGTFASLAGDTTWQWRLHQWEGTWRMIVAHPWFGWGLGSYAAAINQFVLDSTPLDMVLKSGANLTQNAHSLYLQMLAELGVLGTALYLWALGAFFVTGVRALRRSSGTQSLSTGRFAVLAACLAAMAGQMVDAATNPAYQFGEVSFFFWLVMGLGMAAARIAPQPEEAAAAVTPVRRRTAPARLAWQGAMLSMVGVVLASGLALGQNFLPQEPIYTEISRFDLTARTPSGNLRPGFARPTLASGECVELQVAIQFVGSNVYEGERSPFVQLARSGGDAPDSCLVQQPAPNQNVFCVPTTAGAECDGKTVTLSALYIFRGQTLSKSVTLTLSGATCGVTASVDRPVLPATGNFETVNVTITTPPGFTTPTLKRVDVLEDPFTNHAVDVTYSGDAILRNTQVQLKAVAGRTYVLLYKTCDTSNRACYVRLYVIVSTRTTFETTTPLPPKV
jgi:O-antigen ligase